MKFFATTLVALSALAGSSDALCETKWGTPCLPLAQMNPTQKYFSPDAECFTYSGKKQCFTRAGVLVIQECKASCANGGSSGSSGSTGNSGGSSSGGGSSSSDCMSGSKKCLSYNEVGGYYHMFSRGNGGDPCFEDANNPSQKWCVTYKNPSTGSVSMGSCSCSNSACGCGSPPPNPCPGKSSPGDDCSTQSQYNSRFGGMSTMARWCGSYGSKCGSQVCNSGDLTTDEKNAALKAHNDLRRRVAKGQETLGGPGPQPAAKDMNELVWDDELAQMAQRFADQCEGGHEEDIGSTRNALTLSGSIGQNMYGAWGNDPRPRNFKAAVQAWYDEVKDFPGRNANAFSSNGVAINPKTGKKWVIGHYTAVVWGATKKVGCGVTNYKTGSRSYKQVLYCNYWPAGNMGGAAMYTTGSAGQAGSLCSNNNDGLCRQ